MTVKNTEDQFFFQFFTEVGIIEQLARARLESALPHGLKISQFSVLNHLVRLTGDWSPTRLADAFQVTKGAMTNTLQRLESRALIKIDADPHDGRGKRVSLTTAGRDMRDLCIYSIAPFLEDLQKNFDVDHFGKVLPLLEEVRKYLDDHRP